MEVVTLFPYHWFERWKETRWKRRGESYEAFKFELAARLQRELELHVPALAGKVDYAELSTAKYASFYESPAWWQRMV